MSDERASEWQEPTREQFVEYLRQNAQAFRIRWTKVRIVGGLIQDAIADMLERDAALASRVAEQDAEIAELKQHVDQARRDLRQALDILENGREDEESLRTVTLRIYQAGKQLAKVSESLLTPKPGDPA